MRRKLFRYIGPKSCPKVGFGSVHVIPTTMMAGMKPQCSTVLAIGEITSQASSALVNKWFNAPDAFAEDIFAIKKS